MRERPFDVVLYGASGFTGRQTVAYFAEHAPPALRWAIAGRDGRRLEEARDRAGAGAAGVELLVADAMDARALDGLAARTRVVLSTAGPFARYGDALVDACVRRRAHYADITGEVAWVRRLIARHHAQAAADGTRIVPFCGFDSVPSDLGVLLAVRALQRSGSAECRCAKTFFRMRGGFNGGTIATALHTAASGDAAEARDPFALDPPAPRARTRAARLAVASRDVTHPAYDDDAGGWVGPFMMGPINTRVVRRSAALLDAWGEGYGPDFAYQEYMRFGGAAPRVAATVATAAARAFERAMARGATRRLVAPLLPKPGEGPSERTMSGGWFRSETVALGAGEARARLVMRHQGDPGNRATVRFLCESALCLALDGDALPGGSARGGVLTPATALGEALARRLEVAGVGMTLEP